MGNENRVRSRVQEIRMRKPFPVGVFIAAALVLTAFFLPWGTASVRWADVKPTMNGQPVDPMVMRDFLASISGRTLGDRFDVPLAPWTQTWIVGNTELPDWLILAAAMWAAGLTLLGRLPGVRMPGWLPLLF